MICAMTARRITEGKSDEFIDKFTSDGDKMPAEMRDRFKGVYACRDVKDPNVILTFGLFDGSLEEFRQLQNADERTDQLERIDPLIEDVLIDGSFEVVKSMFHEPAATI
jgi:hypothetical protein